MPLLRRAALLLGLSSLLTASTLLTTVATTATAAPDAVATASPGAATLEALAPPVPATSCERSPGTGAVALGRSLSTAYPRTGYAVTVSCDAPALDEQRQGRGVSWKVSVHVARQVTQARTMLGRLLGTDDAGQPYAVARRLGVTRVVWADREWRSDAADAGWTPYSTCATSRATRDDARCGRSAMQIALGWAGATGRTSYWTGSVAPEDFGPCRPADLSWAEQYRGPRADPCPVYPAPQAPAGATARDRALVAWSGARVGAGTKGAAARAVQGALRVEATGSFTSEDAAKLRSWQRRHDLPATGAADTGTWRALLGTTLSVPMVTSALPASTMPTSSPTGWRRIYSQDFLTTAPIGSFTAARKDDWYLQTTNPYARSLRSYPDGWGTTGNLSLNYASKTVDVVDQDHGAAGVFRLNAKTDTVDGRRRSLAGSFFAVLDPTASGNAQVAQTYGRYSVRFRTVGGYPANHAGPGYGSAFLLWPADDTWNNGEIDFPEMAWGNKIGGFVHTIGNPSVNATVMTSTVPTDDTWHVATIEWKPIALVFSIDGTVLQTVTQNVPNKPFRWGFQSGGHDGTPADGVTGQLLVDWITIDAYAGKV